MASSAVPLHLPPERLAAVLGVPPDAVETALIEVGVDGDYLARALLEGDPQHTLPAVAKRLGLQKPDLVIALVKALIRQEGNLDRVPQLLDAALHQLADPHLTRARTLLAQETRAPPPDVRPAPDDDPEALRRLVREHAPRLLRRTAVATGVLGAASVGFGLLALFALDVFRTALLYVQSATFVGLGAALLYATYRLLRAAVGPASEP